SSVCGFDLAETKQFDTPGELDRIVVYSTPEPDEDSVADTPLQVLLLEQIHPDAEDLLRNAGFRVRTVDRALSEDDLIAELPGVARLGIRSKTNVPARVIEAGDSLLAVGAFCIGTNQIDLVSAAEHGVTVFNAPFSNTRSVVELAIAEIIAMTRRLTEKNALM